MWGLPKTLMGAMALLLLVLLGGGLPHGAHGSLQGLYVMQSRVGQLQRVDPRTGGTTNIGPTLKSRGWHVPDCTPSDVDRTGKWYFVLAKNASAMAEHNSNSSGGYNTEGSSTPWTLIGILLADASIRTTQQLPSIFSPYRDACEHVVSVNSGWDAIVTAVTQEHTSHPHLAIAILNYTFPVPGKAKVLVNQSITPLGLGGAAKHPTAGFDINMGTLWVQLEKGLVECDLTAGACKRTILFGNQNVFTGLQYQPGGTMYGVLAAANGDASAPGAGNGAGDDAALVRALALFKPQTDLTIQRMPLSTPVAVRRGGATVALISDHAQMVLLAANGTLTTANVNGTITSPAVPLCQGKTACPASMVYEPFVF